MINASHEALEFTLPDARWGRKWVEQLNTSQTDDAADEEKAGRKFVAGDKIQVDAWSLLLLRRRE